MFLFDQPPPAIIIPKPKEIIRPGDPRFVIPQQALIVGVVRKKVRVATMIAAAAATAIGDMTGNASITRLFNGNTNETGVNEVYRVGADGYGGADYAADHTLSHVVCYGLGTQGCVHGSNPSTTLRLFVKTSAGATPSDTPAGTVTFTDTADNTARTIICTVGTPIRSFVVKVDTGASGNSTGFSEIEAWEFL